MELLTLAPGSDKIPVELFQILKDDAVESAALNMQYAICTQYAICRLLALSPMSGPLSLGVQHQEEEHPEHLALKAYGA